MNAFDFLIVLILGCLAILGAWRGLVREFMSLLTWIVACVVAWVFAADAAPVFSAVVAEPVFAQVLGLTLIFLGVFVTGTIIARLMDKLVMHQKVLRVPNRVVGALFGVGRGVVIVVVAFMLAGLTSFPQRPWWRQAFLAPYFEQVALFAANYVPRDVARHIRYG